MKKKDTKLPTDEEPASRTSLKHELSMTTKSKEAFLPGPF